MIENDQQLILTQRWLAQFEESLETLGAVPQSTLHPKQRQAYQDATRSILKELREQVRVYEAERE